MNAPITILNDDTVENTETVVLMGSTSPGVKASFAPGQDRVTVSIYDNDGEGIFLNYLLPIYFISSANFS